MSTTSTAAVAPPARPVRLGLRENWLQFTLLVIVNACVGGLVGLERDPSVDAALMNAVLNESGYAAFTTTAVARRAGASTASLYRRCRPLRGVLVFVLIARFSRAPNCVTGPRSTHSPERSRATSRWTN